MKTSSKLRRLRRMRKLRRQRSIAFVVVMILLLTAAHVAFSSYCANDESHDVISVVVKKGDTLWSIAKEHMPEGENIAQYVYEISADNGIKDGNIYCGQTIFVPVTNF